MLETLFGVVPLASDTAQSAPFTHDRALVGLSMVAAVAGALAFLELGGRGHERSGLASVAWNAAAGVMLGALAFTSHFIGLLAFDSPLMHGFVLVPTLASALLALACGALTAVFAGRNPTVLRLFLAGLSIGAVGVTMHYMGMQAMRIEAVLSYRPLYMAATAGGACVGSMAGFWLAHHLRNSWARAAMAFPIGAATAGLHYVDMSATVITPRPAFAPPEAAINETWIAAAITAAMIAAALAAAAAAMFDRRAAAERAEHADDDVVIIPDPSPAQSSDTVVLDTGRTRPQG